MLPRVATWGGLSTLAQVGLLSAAISQHSARRGHGRVSMFIPLRNKSRPRTIASNWRLATHDPHDQVLHSFSLFDLLLSGLFITGGTRLAFIVTLARHDFSWALSIHITVPEMPEPDRMETCTEDRKSTNIPMHSIPSEELCALRRTHSINFPHPRCGELTSPRSTNETPR